MPVHVGEAEVAAGVVVGKAFVVEAEEVEDGGLEVVDVDFVFRDMEAKTQGRWMLWDSNKRLRDVFLRDFFTSWQNSLCMFPRTWC
jgi:hypothetical protein